MSLLLAAPAFAQEDLPPEPEVSARAKVEQASSAEGENAARAPETASVSAKTVSVQRWAGARWFGYGFAGASVIPGAILLGSGVSTRERACTGDALGCRIVRVGSLAVGTAVGIPMAVLVGAPAGGCFLGRFHAISLTKTAYPHKA